MTWNSGSLNAMRRAFVRALAFLCILLAVNVPHSFAQGDVDSHTLLMLRFENSLAGEQGQTPTQASGVTFEAGISGQGVLVDGADVLDYSTEGNFNAQAGTIEFWVKPRWFSYDVLQRYFLSVETPGSPNNRLTLFRLPNSSLNFIIGAEDSEANQSSPSLDWNANEWHFVAVTWTVPGRMIVYVDGLERLNHPTVGEDLLSPVPPTLRIGSGGNNHMQIDSVVDDLRISNVARTPEEIAARYFAGVNVKSISLSVVTKTLWKTWLVTPTVTADTSLGTITIAPSALSWSSSNPSVATVNADGRIVGVGPGSAVLTATLNGARASLSVNVRAPALPPRVEVPPDALARPAPGALYEIPVVILRYLPTADGANLDVAWSPDFYALNPIPLAQLEQSLNQYDPILKFMLEEGSRFRGYGSQQPAPSLGYRVVAVITVYEPTPPGKVTRIKQGLPMYDADWFQIFERFGMKDYVNKLGVKEVWFWWGGVQPEIPSYDPAIHPPENMREGWESNMSSPTTGDISNSNRDNTDLPIYDKTYFVYFRNIRRLDPTTIHGDGHQLESMFSYANFRQTGDTQMFWQKFVGQSSSGTWQRGRSGDTHHPPNAAQDYDYANFTPFDSDIMDWKPDGGQLKPFSAATLRDTPYSLPNNFFTDTPYEALWHIFWRQSMPGRDNGITFGANRMTNWWQFVGDWDAAINAGIGLYESSSCSYALSSSSQSFATDGGTGSVMVTSGAGCRWIASSNAPWVAVTSGATSNGGNKTVNFSVAPNSGGAPRTATLAVAGQTYTVTQAPAPPVLLTEQDSQRAIVLTSVNSLRDPFQTFDAHNFSADQRTRLMLFVSPLDFAPGENASIVTAQAEDSQHRVIPLTIEYVGKVPGQVWLTQINVRVPDELANAGDVWVTISLRGVPSNKALINIGQ
jgi:uncharacterized protein (TIGR03437 family)